MPSQLEVSGTARRPQGGPMNRTQQLVDDVKSAIDGLALQAPEVTVGWTPGGNAILTVVSPSYSSMDESERQSQVWQVVREAIDDDERLSAIEFIFTLSPSELEQMASDDG